MNEFADLISTYYDGMAGQYSQIADSARYGIPKWLKSKLSGIGSTAPRVLDLGCANGYLGGIVKEAFTESRLIGVDISPQMIEELKKSGVYEDALVWDLSRGLPSAAKGRYDLVLAIGFLEFIKDPSSLFKDISVALGPSGRCFASFESFDPKKFGSKTVQNSSTGFHRYLYSLEDIKPLIHTANMVIQTHETIPAYVSPSSGEAREYHVLSLALQ